MLSWRTALFSSAAALRLSEQSFWLWGREGSVHTILIFLSMKVYIHTKGILTNVIIWGRAGEKLYSRPYLLTDERKNIIELDADTAAESTGLRPLYNKDLYEGNTLQSLIFGTCYMYISIDIDVDIHIYINSEYFFQRFLFNCLTILFISSQYKKLLIKIHLYKAILTIKYTCRIYLDRRD